MLIQTETSELKGEYTHKLTHIYMQTIRSKKKEICTRLRIRKNLLKKREKRRKKTYDLN